MSDLILYLIYTLCKNPYVAGLVLCKTPCSLIREMERSFLKMCHWRERSCLAVRDVCRTQVSSQGLEFPVFSTIFQILFIYLFIYSNIHRLVLLMCLATTLQYLYFIKKVLAKKNFNFKCATKHQSISFQLSPFRNW